MTPEAPKSPEGQLIALRHALRVCLARQMGFAVLLALGSSRLPAQMPPHTPIVARGACPFECCQLGAWRTQDTLAVYARPRPSTSVGPLFQLLPGQSFVADSADFYTLALGLIRVRRPFRLVDYLAQEAAPDTDAVNRKRLQQPLAAGDTIYFVGDVTEVGELVWWRGVSATVEPFWEEPGAKNAAAPAAMIRPIVQEWWVHISQQNRSGWIQAWQRNIDGTDACA